MTSLKLGASCDAMSSRTSFGTDVILILSDSSVLINKSTSTGYPYHANEAPSNVIVDGGGRADNTQTRSDVILNRTGCKNDACARRSDRTSIWSNLVHCLARSAINHSPASSSPPTSSSSPSTSSPTTLSTWSHKSEYDSGTYVVGRLISHYSV